MAEEHQGPPSPGLRRVNVRPPWSRERWIAAAIILLVVLIRSVVFVFWEQSYYDSDQAIVGLMAKHLIEGRAFPVFFYGQSYMLGVEAYLAAPVFLIAGISVAALKFPLLLINLAVALMLLRTLEREVGLRPYVAMIPVLFFAVPAPGVTAEILAPNGGNVAPFIYTALIWLTRNRPNWCGFFFGLGFLQREFTLYAMAALLGVELITGALRTRDGIRRRLTTFRTAIEVWLVVHILKSYSSAAGPGTSTADLMNTTESAVAFARRFCTDPAMIPRGLTNLFTEHFPVLFGTRPMALSELAIESASRQGFPGAWIFLALTVAIAIAAVAVHVFKERRWRPAYPFCAYLILTALLSEAGYIVGRCGGLHHFTLRYELLSVIGLTGLGAWFLAVTPAGRLRTLWIGAAAGVVLTTALPSVRLLVEYVRHEPVNPKRLIVQHLDARGIKYAFGDYWRAYLITFMTNERIIVAADDFQRIRVYSDVVKAHKDEAVRIAREFCPGGKPAMQGLWICPYERVDESTPNSQLPTPNSEEKPREETGRKTPH
jgi:hypothetical protein